MMHTERGYQNDGSSACVAVTIPERQRLLHVVIVGGGPTGVEFAGELSDFVSRVSCATLLHALCNISLGPRPQRTSRPTSGSRYYGCIVYVMSQVKLRLRLLWSPRVACRRLPECARACSRGLWHKSGHCGGRAASKRMHEKVLQKF